jgi:hypothetical protein
VTLLTQEVAARIRNKMVYAIWGQGWQDGDREKNIRRLMVVHAPEIDEDDMQSGWMNGARIRMDGKDECNLSYDWYYRSDGRAPIVTGSGSDPIFVFSAVEVEKRAVRDSEISDQKKQKKQKKNDFL